MKTFLTFFLVTLSFFSYAQPVQDTVLQEKGGVYNINPAVDLSITAGGLITNYIGLRILRNKREPDSAVVVNLTPEDIPLAIDRGAAKQDPAFSETANNRSDWIMYVSNVLPAVLAFDKKIMKEKYRVLLLYLETHAVMGNLYFLTMSLGRRKRPYVFNPDESMIRRTYKGATNSFYAGHPAQTAAGTFFMAKAINDFHPEWKNKGLFFAAAALPPLAVGYYRYKAGQHFPTDILVGVGVGAAVGILVPEIHKKIEDIPLLSLSPYFYDGAKGLTVKFDLSKD